ncbi:glutathione-disulfide reductase [Sphingorhabdus lutea]|uniref:Glutathione-disulfide reductase n=1 Tax=Sphingorhabdus lutea TaxID=1913578 RepID=A0A1L3JEZ3_9SPHN|nr:glutathione-disulfide reductase [Sphingorhabdus lutea]APG63690.1 glutathione-disulfide reductase [Sphingorhabdus lutea]
MPNFDYDLFVIGAGSGGVRASRIAASHGAKVAVAEEYRVGGTCVIRGCVPKKMLVYASHFAEELHDAANYGWDISKDALDWPRLRDHILNDVNRLNGLYQNTLNNNDVTTFLERATVSGPNEILLASGKKITAKYILIAVGAWPDMPKVDGIEYAVTSNEMFHLENLPKRLFVYGGGYIANEFAGIFNGLGSQVTLANRSERLLRSYDQQIVERLTEISIAKGIDIKLNFEVAKIVKQPDGSFLVHSKHGDEPVETDVVLVATGRRAKTDDLGLQNVGVNMDAKGAILVDDRAQTNIPSIYAVGDVTDRVQLTPVAIREGQALADRLFGDKDARINYDYIPSAVFSQPPIASVGLTEGEARQKFGDVKIFQSDFRSMKNIFADRAERSLYKMIVHPTDDKVLGIHMISPEAPEILQLAAVAVKAGLSKQAFDDTIALHPSMAEELVLLK